MFLSWKVKVVHSLCVLLLLTEAVWAQSPRTDLLDRKITLSCHQISCEDVLQLLTQKTNISFVYSTSILDLQRPVSFSIYKQSLKDVLETIGRQLNVSFKLEGDHIILKKIGEAQPVIKTKIVPKEINESESIFRDDVLSAYAMTSLSPLQTFGAPSTFDLGYQSDSSLSKRTAKLLTRAQRQLLLSKDSSAKTQYVNPKKWFASTGVFVNDYTLSGLEVQGGLRSFYAVANASLINNNLYRFGYGAGTSLTLSEKWALQLVYTTAKLTKSEDFANFVNAIKLTSQHHQIKLATQYSLSPRINFKMGVTLNILNTRYKFMGIEVPSIIYNSRPHEPPHNEPHQSYLSEILQSSNTIIAPYTLSNNYSDNHYLNTKTWLGFEAGVSYQINFPFNR